MPQDLEISLIFVRNPSISFTVDVCIEINKSHCVEDIKVDIMIIANSVFEIH